MNPTFPQVRLADVAATVGAEVRGDPDATVRDASNDSRDVPPGSLFFCIPGDVVDGHAFAQQAVDAGASALVVDHPLAVAAPQLVVRSVREAIGPMAAEVFGRPAEGLTLVGVTGTNGKTTITFLLEAVFRAAGWRPGVIGTTGLRIDGEPSPLAHTTPEAPELHRALARMRAADVRAVAIEISSHALGAAPGRRAASSTPRCSRTCPRTISTSTVRWRPTSTPKRLLFTPGARAPRGRERGRSLGAPAPRGPARSPSRASVWTPRPTCTRPTWWWTGAGSTATVDGVVVRSDLRGPFNVENVLGALAAARVVGVGLDVGARGVTDVRRVPGRMEPIDAGQRLHRGSGLRTHAG